MQPQVRLKYRDRKTGEEQVTGILALSVAQYFRDSGWYPDACIVRDEEGWPEWEEPNRQLKMF